MYHLIIAGHLCFKNRGNVLKFNTSNFTFMNKTKFFVVTIILWAYYTTLGVGTVIAFYTNHFIITNYAEAKNVF